MAEKCSAALPTMGRTIRPTKRGFKPTWWVNGSMVLTSTSLTTAVTAVAADRMTMGSQRVVCHQVASEASNPALIAFGFVVASAAGAVEGARSECISALLLVTVGATVGSLSSRYARTPKTE